MSNCGNSIISVSFSSSANYYKGGTKLVGSEQLPELTQIALADSLKNEFSNWIIIGADDENTSNCSLHCMIAPVSLNGGNALSVSFFQGGELLSPKIAEGIAYPDQTMVAESFNNSGITISMLWSGNLPRSDIQYVYYQLKAGTVEPEARSPELESVKTVVIYNGEGLDKTNSSDSKGTLPTTYANALTFGNLAPGETSNTLIIYLNVPSAIAITNIRLGLMEAGGIDLQAETFGVDSNISLDTNFVPDSYFTALNKTDESTNEHNIDIGNKDYYTSEYVYLNVSLPLDQDLGTGVIRYKWFFDYA